MIKPGSLWKVWPYKPFKREGDDDFELCIVIGLPEEGSYVYKCLSSSGAVTKLTLEAYPNLYEPFQEET